MQIFFNGKSEEVNDSETISSLLDQFSVNALGVAIAINNTIIPKAKWETKKLNNGDNILMITATKGG